MTGWIEDNLLRFEGLSDDDIRAINAILPDVERLTQALQQEWPTISKVVGVLLPIAQKVVKKQQELK